MTKEILESLDSFFKTVDIELKEYKEIKEKLLKDREFMDKIKLFHELNPYSQESKELRYELFQIEQYKKYLEYEKNLLFLSLSLTNKLKSLTRGEAYESN